MGGGAMDFEMDTKPKTTDRAPAQNAAPVNSAAPGRGIVLERFFTRRASIRIRRSNGNCAPP